MALRHVAFEDLGLFAPIMEREGWDVAFCEAAVDDLSHHSIKNAELLIILGGPIGVCETDDYPFLTAEIALIEYRLSRDLPTLGICLGSQLMARALGGRVFKGPVKEIDWGTVDLTQQGRSSCLKALQGDDAVVLHWHGDTFDLPREATRLASNRNYENQAFSTDATRLRFSSTWRPIRGSSKSGMSATRSSLPPLKYPSQVCEPPRNSMRMAWRFAQIMSSAAGYASWNQPTFSINRR